MKIILDVTGIKDHPDINSVYGFLEEHGFATPFCDEIRKFLPDNADSVSHGEYVLSNFYVRSKVSFVEAEGKQVKCWAAIVPNGKTDYMLIVFAECKYDDFAKLERVIAHYRGEICADKGTKCEYSENTKVIMTYLVNLGKCPFCELHEEMEFGSEHCFAQLDDDGLVNIYTEGQWQGSFKFPKCPCCGKDIKQP